MTEYFFPFGEKLKRVRQEDTSPNKELFVLGVYASAVHAKWLKPDGAIEVQALAVASEPEIFWTGQNAEEIISNIEIPKDFAKHFGKLVPANKNLNGPSGRALDDFYLKPLGLDRSKVWLCDLLPESRVNVNQRVAVKLYNSIIENIPYYLPFANIPDFDENEINNNAQVRKDEIVNEIESSGAKKIILLGDLPIYWFLHYFDKRKKLSDFGNTNDTYGVWHEVMINGNEYLVMPLCHPRNAAKLGAHSGEWTKLHQDWVEKMNATI